MDKESKDTSVSGTQDELWLHQAQRKGENKGVRKKEKIKQRDRGVEKPHHNSF